MINEIIKKGIVDEETIMITTLDKLVGETLIDGVDNNEVIVLIKPVNDISLEEVVNRLEEEDIALIELLSQTVSERVLELMPENTEVALMMLWIYKYENVY